MCRLGLFPPGFSGEDAFDAMLFQSKGNGDGVGVGYEEKGKFKVVKTGKSIFNMDRRPLTKHMPHGGWTIFHTRSATVGKPEDRNAHPFITENFVVAHNGTFKNHRYVRDAAPHGALKGETDSEAGAYLLSKLGPKRFFKEYVEREFCGVFAAIDAKGNLWIFKDTHSLYTAETDFGTVFTTERVFKDSESFDNGMICISPNNDVLEWEYEKPTRASSSFISNSHSRCDDNVARHTDTPLVLAGWTEDGRHIKQNYNDGVYNIQITYPGGAQSKLCMTVPMYDMVNGKIVNYDSRIVAATADKPIEKRVENPARPMSDEELQAKADEWVRLAANEKTLFDVEGCD